MINKLVYFEEYDYVYHAIDREKQLKKWSRKKKVDLIKKTNKEILAHLPNFYSIKKNDSIIGENCTICCDSFNLGQFQRKLHICNHIFHKKCIDKWFCINEYNMVCPLCKFNYSK